MTHPTRLVAEIPPIHRRDGLRWVVLEVDTEDTGGVYLYWHTELDSEAAFDDWYEDVERAKAGAVWRGIPMGAWATLR
jgi:hypothetical protein